MPSPKSLSQALQEGDQSSWQFRWNRPQWTPIVKDPDNTNTNHKDSAHHFLVQHISARVSPEEVERLSKKDCDNAHNFLVSATFLSRTNPQGPADVLRLELEQIPITTSNESNTTDDEDTDDASSQPGAIVLLSKQLYWPETMLSNPQPVVQEEGNDDDVDDIVAYGNAAEPEDTGSFSLLSSLWSGHRSRRRRRRKSKRRKGLVSGTLLRETGPHHEQTDAENVLRLLSMGWMGNSSSGTPPESDASGNNNNNITSTATDTPEEIGTLHLACLSNEGFVYIYNILDLLMGNSSSAEAPDDVESLLLGNLLSRLYDSVRPLSHPIAKVSLSVCMDDGRSGKKRQQESSESLSSSSSVHQQQPQQQPLSIWDSMIWNPTAEQSTFCFATTQNSARLCMSILNYLVIAGPGHRRKEQTTEDPILRRSSSLSSLHSRFSVTSSVDSSNNIKPYSGGFVTFLTTRPYAEHRTVYLPFPPESISQWSWGDHSFVLVLGDSQAVAIPVDLTTPTVLKSGTPFGSKNDAQQQHEESQDTEIVLEPFQLVPVCLPQFNTIIPTMFSSGNCLHPSIDLAFYESNSLTIVRKRVECFDLVPTESLGSSVHGEWEDYACNDGSISAVKTDHTSHDVVTINLEDYTLDASGVWFHGGQSYSLVGVGGHIFYVCWEGKTLYRDISDGCWDTVRASDVLPLTRTVSDASADNIGLGLAFDDNPSFEGLTFSADEADQKDFIAEAIKGLSPENPPCKEDESPSVAEEEGKTLTSQDRAKRLLSFCPPWVELDRVRMDAGAFDNQVPNMTVRFSSNDTVENFSLTSRAKTKPVKGLSTFQMVMTWLSSTDDYFTASSLALALLGDSSTLKYMWRRFGMIESYSSLVVLEHLVDGIEDDFQGAKVKELADMATICMVRGGHAMASTLQKFLLRDRHYDADMCAVILAATAACTLSEDEATVTTAMGKLYIATDSPLEDVLWPVDNLLIACVSRAKVDTAILLLSATVSERLRNVRLDPAYSPDFSLEVCESLVSRVVASDSRACNLLLSSTIEAEKTPFWESLDKDTQLHLSLLRIDQSYPFLLHPITRSWILQKLCAEASPGSTSGQPSKEWLESCVRACMVNAKCEFSPTKKAFSASSDTGFEAFLRSQKSARRLIKAKPGTGGMDFTVVISALLILEKLQENWKSQHGLPTQTVLNAACYLAGRRSEDELNFPVDGQLLMKQCTIAENVQAGAHLIGGKNGLVLDCCDILMSGIGLDMETAELLLLSGDLEIGRVALVANETGFQATEHHYRVLQHLEECVLKVRTYGEFDMSHARGHVDPVFASNVCFRTWWCITGENAKEAAFWLEDWLREKLEMSRETGFSPLRLACAALTRSLIWSGDSTEEVGRGSRNLGAVVQLSHLFLVQLAQSCCGLVEAVPKQIAKQVVEKGSQEPTLNASAVVALPSVSADASFEETFISATSSLPSSPRNSFASPV